MIERRTLWAMALGSGLAVANIYYVQPLLADMGRYFGVPDRRMGLISMLSQVGYATGMLLFLPLGDRLERRSFILAMLGAVAVALLGVAVAPCFAWLAAASLAVGVTTITPQLLVAFAAHLAEPAERGRVVGTVMSGLLIGILAARTVSGVVGSTLGWRTMYGIASAVMVALAVSLKELLPRSQPESLGISYVGVLRSIGALLRDEPVLRQSCLLGAMSFGAFSAFWTTLAFHLASPSFGYGSGVAGLFGLVGIVGALAAPLVGRFGQPCGQSLESGPEPSILTLRNAAEAILGVDLKIEPVESSIELKEEGNKDGQGNKSAISLEERWRGPSSSPAVPPAKAITMLRSPPYRALIASVFSSPQIGS
jgi:MFS family permease